MAEKESPLLYALVAELRASNLWLANRLTSLEKELQESNLKLTQLDGHNTKLQTELSELSTKVSIIEAQGGLREPSLTYFGGYVSD